MIRTIVAIVFIVLFLILSLPVWLVLQLIGLFSPESKAMASLAIIRWAFSAVLFITGTKITVKGKENIPEDRAVLYVANHRSIFDILINYVYMKRPTGFISKIEMKKVPIFNMWMKNIGCLFLDRNDIRQGMQTILKAVDSVKKGTSIFIFPEGTRSKVEGEFLPFKGGSFKIAEKSSCDVIPVTIVGSADIFEDHKPKVKKTHVIIEYGKPFVTRDMSKEEIKALPEAARQLIIETHERNKEEAV